MGTLLQKLEYLEQTKVDIKNALIAQNVDVTDADTFRSYAEYIANLQNGTPSGRAGALYGRGGIGIGGLKEDII